MYIDGQPRLMLNRGESRGTIKLSPQMRGTPMAEAILFAASDIIRREETLKIVLVVTDGEPNDREATKYVIDRARADGVTVVGLGIGVDTSPVFDTRYAATILNIGELSASMVRLVKAAFEDNRRMN